MSIDPKPFIKNATKLLRTTVADLEKEWIKKLDALTKAIAVQLNTMYAGSNISELREIERQNYIDGAGFGRIPYIEFDPPFPQDDETIKIKSIEYDGKPNRVARTSTLSHLRITLVDNTTLPLVIRFSVPDGMR